MCFHLALRIDLSGKGCGVIRIIVDSTCDIPEELQERFHISVLPLSVIIDGTAYRDRIEIQLDDVYKAMREGKMPGTAQIRWEDTEALFSSVAESGDDFIYLSFSSSMSGTFDLANTARRVERRPGGANQIRIKARA